MRNGRHSSLARCLLAWLVCIVMALSGVPTVAIAEAIGSEDALANTEVDDDLAIVDNQTSDEDGNPLEEIEEETDETSNTIQNATDDASDSNVTEGQLVPGDEEPESKNEETNDVVDIEEQLEEQGEDQQTIDENMPELDVQADPDSIKGELAGSDGRMISGSDSSPVVEVWDDKTEISHTLTLDGYVTIKMLGKTTIKQGGNIVISPLSHVEIVGIGSEPFTNPLDEVPGFVIEEHAGAAQDDNVGQQYLLPGKSIIRAYASKVTFKELSVTGMATDAARVFYFSDFLGGQLDPGSENKTVTFENVWISRFNHRGKASDTDTANFMNSGLIYNQNLIIKMEDCNIDHNYSRAILINNANGTMNVIGSKIDSNDSWNTIYNWNSVNTESKSTVLRVYGSTLTNNAVSAAIGKTTTYAVGYTGRGGAIASKDAYTFVTSSTFSDNKAIMSNTTFKGDGGAIYNGLNAVLTIGEDPENFPDQYTLFDGNEAANFGGAVTNARGDVRVFGGTFKNNKAAYGGALANHSGNTADTIQETLLGNSGYMTIFAGTFGTDNNGNEASKSGGAICEYQAARLNIFGGTFQYNKAANNGGAIFAFRNQEDTAVAIRTDSIDFSGGTGDPSEVPIVISNNTAANTGGGVCALSNYLYMGGSNITIKDNVSVNDKGPDLGVIALKKNAQGEVERHHVTLTAPIDGSEIHFSLLDKTGVESKYVEGRVTNHYFTYKDSDGTTHEGVYTYGNQNPADSPLKIEQTGYTTKWGSNVAADGNPTSELWVAYGSADYDVEIINTSATTGTGVAFKEGQSQTGATSTLAGVNAGGIVVLAFKPADGNELTAVEAYWKGDESKKVNVYDYTPTDDQTTGSSFTPEPGYIYKAITMPINSVIVKPTFSAATFTIAAYTSDDNCTTTLGKVTCNTELNDAGIADGIPYGTSVTFEVEAVPGYKFLGWYPVTEVDEYTGLVSSYDASNCLQPAGTGDEVVPYTTQVTSDLEVVAVFSFNGSGQSVFVEIVPYNFARYTVGNDGTLRSGEYTTSIKEGQRLTITADEGDKVLYWQNGNSKIIGSAKCKQLTMTVTDNLWVGIYYEYDKSANRNQTMVRFISDYGQVMEGSREYKMGETNIEIPTGPNKTGYLFDKWVFGSDVKDSSGNSLAGTDATVDTIHQLLDGTRDGIDVVCKYNRRTDAGSLNVKYKNQESNEVQIIRSYASLTPGTIMHLTAANTFKNGAFRFWSGYANQKFSYDKEISFIIGSNRLYEFQANYGGAEVTPEPLMYLECPFTFEEGGGWTAGFTAVRYVPAGWSVTEHGVLCNRTADKKTSLEDITKFVIGSPDVVKFVDNKPNQELTGWYTATMSKSTKSPYVNCRGYLCVTSPSGQIKRFYSDYAVVNKTFDELQEIV